jgi:hypothetical protein
MTLATWLRLLHRNRWAVDGRRLPMAVAITAYAAANSLLATIQQRLFARRLRKTQVRTDPVFVIGHWRSGTTLLHELMTKDPRHAFPTTYACYSPSHFLLTEPLAARWLGFLLPKKRLQDNVPLAWKRPQEDEFALCNLGARSPFLTTAFPNRPPADAEYLDLEGLEEADVDHWKMILWRFARDLSCRDTRRIIFKSPPHTCRIRHLLDLFPDARFVHIARDPYAVVASTIRLWQIMYASQGLQVPNYVGLEEHVLETFVRVHTALAKSRPLIPPGRLAEVRYEEVVRDPIGSVESIYRQLDLGAFEPAREPLDEYLVSIAGYQTREHDVPTGLRAAVDDRLRQLRTTLGNPPIGDRQAHHV